jgi:hypothetical protein
METQANAKDLLAELVDKYGPTLIEGHQWFDERDRWVELVLALVARCTAISEHEVRLACMELTQKGLLDRPAAMRAPDNREAIQQVLKSHGLSPGEATKALIALTEVSENIDVEFNGKLQLYLRQSFDAVAEQMLTVFPVSVLSNENLRHAYRFWLQNVASAPLSLTHPNARTFCESRQVAWDEMIEAADDADINLALLDDIVHAAHDDETRQSNEK